MRPTTVVLLIFSAAFNIACFATPFWTSTQDVNRNVIGYRGLWQTCNVTCQPNTTNCQTICTHSNSEGPGNIWLKAVQGLDGAGLVLYCLAAMVSLILCNQTDSFAVFEDSLGNRIVITLLTLSLAVITPALILFGVESNNSRAVDIVSPWTPTGPYSIFYWSYWMHIAGWAFLVIANCCVIQEERGGRRKAYIDL